MADLPNLLISDLLKHWECNSRSVGIPLNDHVLLLCDILGCHRTELYLRRHEYLTPAQADRLNSHIERLYRHEPVQYILSRSCFYGREFSVSPAVLIPRPETEGLVEIILNQMTCGMRILDIGTGSGVIAITLKASEPSLVVDATDISPEAIAIARINAQSFDCDIDFYCADLFPSVARQYDLIISNPPYITTEEYRTLPSRIRDYEPARALIAGEDGLSYYRSILSRSGQHRHPHTRFYFEIGSSQAGSIEKLAKEAGFSHIEIRKDLNGLDRFAIVN